MLRQIIGSIPALADSFRQILGWIPALVRASGVTLLLTATSVSAGLILSVFLALGKISTVHGYPNVKWRKIFHTLLVIFGLILLVFLGLLLWQNTKYFRIGTLVAAVAFFTVLLLDEPIRVAIVRWLSSAYIFFFRGTPLLMQLFFIYYTLPYILPKFAINDRFFAAFLAFTLIVAAYLAEIIRAAIQSIDKGQFEASRALGLSYAQTMRMIVIPQSYRRMIPPVCNEFVMVLKDTSLVSIIALTDLTFQTQMIASNKSSSLVYVPAMVIYLILTAFFTIIFNRLGKKPSSHL
jgi:polar amino acid transport system permease protein